jgi:hypothetical protein
VKNLWVGLQSENRDIGVNDDPPNGIGQAKIDNLENKWFL